MGPNHPIQSQKTSAADLSKVPSFTKSMTAALRSAGVESPDAVFERALADRERPDLQQLDDYLEGLIQGEMNKGGWM